MAFSVLLEGESYSGIFRLINKRELVAFSVFLEGENYSGIFRLLRRRELQWHFPSY